MEIKNTNTQSTNNPQAVQLVGSIVASLIPITEKAAMVHVWTTIIPEQDDTKSPWERHPVCPSCYVQMSSIGHECW